MKEKVAIIGAGVSGMTVAHILQSKGLEVKVFERDSRPGGLIKCRKVNGSLFHTCGGHVFNSKRQDVLDWFWNHFRREEEFTKTDRNSVVFMDEAFHVPYPIENHVYLFDKETQLSFIRDVKGMFCGNHPEPANFEEFLKLRFGETLYQLYFQPYNEKVWRRRLSEVPLSWLEGKLPMPTAEEMIFNNMNHVEEKAFVHATFWYEKSHGSQLIADRLAEGLNIVYDTPVSSLERQHQGWLIQGEMFDMVVFCGNIKDIPSVIKGVDIQGYENAINRLEYHGTTSVFCEIDKNPYSWIYLPNNQYESHRIICTGNFSPANNGKEVRPDRITATVEFTDKIGHDDILRNLSLMPLHPSYITHHFNPFTYPIQNADTRDMIKNLKKTLQDKGFFLTGRFADWEYYNMDVAMGAAMDLCQQIPL